MEVSYQRDMNHNYMILKCEDDLHEESYETRMIFANKIPGLLSCHIRYIDGRTYLGYDVTCRQNLSVFCESRKQGRKEIRNILGSILETISVMEEYLLSPDHLMLDPQLVFVNFVTQEAVLVFAPFFRKDIRKSLKELTDYLLTFVAHDDQQGIVLGYRISHELTETDAGVAELLGILHERESPEEEIRDSAFYENSQRNIKEELSSGAELYRDNGRTERKETESERMPVGTDGPPCAEKPDGPRAGPNRVRRSRKQRIVKRTLCIVGVGILVAAGTYLGLHFFYPAVLQDTETVLKIVAAVFIIAAATGAGIYMKRREKRVTERRKSYKSLPEREDDNSYSGVFDAEGCKNLICDTDDSLRDDTAHSLLRDESEPAAQIQDSYREPGTKNADGMRTLAAAWKAETGTEVTALLTGGPQGEMTPAFLVPENTSAEFPMIQLSDREVLIGKQKELVSCVIDAPAVSRVHARIRRGVDGYYLRDLNSTNGTSVNGEMILGNEEVRLCPGDHVALADIVYIMK